MSLFTKLPRWATGAGASIVEPTETKKNNGWIASEKPPAEYENWKWKTLHDCLVVMDGLQSLPLTWAAAHVFNSTVTINTAPTLAAHAARKAEVDAEATARANADALKANLSGANFSGPVTVQPPTVAANPARKDQIDGRLAKAWAKLTLGPSGAVTINEQINVASASWSTNVLTINLTTPLSSQHASIFSVYHSSGTIQTNVNVRGGVNSTSQVFVLQMDPSANPINFSGGIIIDVLVIGL